MIESAHCTIALSGLRIYAAGSQPLICTKPAKVTHLVAGHINEVFLLPLRLERFFYPRLLNCLGPLKLGDVRHRPHDGAVWISGGGYQDPGRRNDSVWPFPFLLEMCRKRVRSLLVSCHVYVLIANL